MNYAYDHFDPLPDVYQRICHSTITASVMSVVSSLEMIIPARVGGGERRSAERGEEEDGDDDDDACMFS